MNTLTPQRTEPDDGHAGAGATPEVATLRERKKLQTRSAIHLAALRMVDEQGLEQTTVDAICREADVAPRTFFNYFPSKAAAALDLPDTVVDEEAAERFRTAKGRLVPALCDLFASAADLHAERARMKDLISRRPELMPALTQWMTALREDILTIAQQRAADPKEAQLAIGLVMAALGGVLHDRDVSDDRPTAQRLRERVAQLIAVHAAKLR